MHNNWLITGGCGFLGTSLVAHLLKSNPKVNIRVLDNLTVGTPEDLSGVAKFKEIKSNNITGSPKGIELVEADIRDVGACIKCCNGVDIIVHLAANTGVAPSVENPRIDMESNVIGTFNMLEAARAKAVGRFIFASSGAPVGETEPPIHENKPCKPVSPYGASKLCGEAYCSSYFRTFGIKTVALRFGNVYGPMSKRKNSVVAKFIKLAFDGQQLEIYGDGSQTRDFLYIDDLINAIMCASKTEIGGEVFQIATHNETTVNEIASMIKDIFEKETGRKIEIIHGSTRLGDVKRNYSDITKAKTVLGWGPKITLQDGIRRTYEWYVVKRAIKHASK